MHPASRERKYWGRLAVGKAQIKQTSREIEISKNMRKNEIKSKSKTLKIL